ncbi:hypothetical protein J2Z32_000578 [Paenibacillus turicensis]|uniref:Uncharacterized protein n=1 Tax=Paenibacillus turicensis TaxID=160487 RepID=A0ABS4FN52_9BACL|nr:hypothetical protein [Paenibacillus turicensis]MBP1903961.1 hypothetical protein [Paenibacillus turicensis]
MRTLSAGQDPAGGLDHVSMQGYGLTCGYVHFLSHALPKEVILRRDGISN